MVPEIKPNFQRLLKRQIVVIWFATAFFTILGASFRPKLSSVPSLYIQNISQSTTLYVVSNNLTIAAILLLLLGGHLLERLQHEYAREHIGSTFAKVFLFLGAILILFPLVGGNTMLLSLINASAADGVYDDNLVLMSALVEYAQASVKLGFCLVWTSFGFFTWSLRKVHPKWMHPVNILGGMIGVLTIMVLSLVKIDHYIFSITAFLGIVWIILASVSIYKSPDCV